MPYARLSQDIKREMLRPRAAVESSPAMFGLYYTEALYPMDRQASSGGQP